MAVIMIKSGGSGDRRLPHRVSVSLHVRTDSLRRASHWVSSVWNSACMRPRYGVSDCGPMTSVASQPIDSTHPGGSLALRVASITVAGGEGRALSVVWLQYVAHHKGPFVTFEPSSVTVVQSWPTSRVHKNG
jgi:hypothetical protein